MSERFEVGSKITLKHKATRWERFKAMFGYKIPELDTFVVKYIGVSNETTS